MIHTHAQSKYVGKAANDDRNSIHKHMQCYKADLSAIAMNSLKNPSISLNTGGGHGPAPVEGC